MDLLNIAIQSIPIALALVVLYLNTRVFLVIRDTYRNSVKLHIGFLKILSKHYVFFIIVLLTNNMISYTILEVNWILANNDILVSWTIQECLDKLAYILFLNFIIASRRNA